MKENESCCVQLCTVISARGVIRPIPANHKSIIHFVHHEYTKTLLRYIRKLLSNHRIRVRAAGSPRNFRHALVEIIRIHATDNCPHTPSHSDKRFKHIFIYSPNTQTHSQNTTRECSPTNIVPHSRFLRLTIPFPFCFPLFPFLYTTQTLTNMFMHIYIQQFSSTQERAPAFLFPNTPAIRSHTNTAKHIQTSLIEPTVQVHTSRNLFTN